jgi:glycerol-3-phosphate dehydrogenase
VLVCFMRYHNAIAISRPEADFIIKTQAESKNNCVVVEVGGKWYDVRRMTEDELNNFVEHLQRQHAEDTRAGSPNPH